ncbi:MAG: hypothetical protein P8R54_30035 [Myxococcota bacterium]|nr:hypothetical protein [Myxococcota bacterium]
MLTLLLALSAQAEEPAPTAPVATEGAQEVITVETFRVIGAVQVPEVVIFMPRITTQEASVEQLSTLIDTRLAEEEARR